MRNPETINAPVSNYFSRTKELIGDLSPAYFAMVMSTGIVSVAAHLLEFGIIAFVLFYLNIALYVTLCCCTLLRFYWFREKLLKDLFDHLRSMGFFTMVAATSLLGAQFIQLTNNYQVAFFLWVVAAILWLIITYTIFTILTVKSDKPPFTNGINGAWLLAVVSTQSLAVLSSKLSMHFDDYKLILNFFAFSMWLWGGMLYIWMISLIFYRYTFFKLSPDDLTPPYWINMGAMAISVLAGSMLIINTHNAPFLNSTLAFLKGFTIFYWATGSWWIPMLFILAIWRHIYKKIPFTYDPLYWGAVFPLGMYTACTYKMAEAIELHFLMVIPKYFMYIALAAWTAAFIGFVRRLMSQLFYIGGTVNAR